ncbi:hypothetical protein HDU87_002143 [Geranomyces variabilis]|uniref:Cytochrome b561 domain-containing protein n=1 Tax=Geranomyces variabilis TaxID=109894 RepID=A0AAD5XTG9_9FUNG|nr:hypothetical protein HDU87_002143 [Geranomyces variabilis]
MTTSTRNRSRETVQPEHEPLLDRTESQEHDPLYYNLARGPALFAQAGIWILATAVWTGIFSSKLMLFTLHPLLNSIGLLLSTQAILLLQPTSFSAPRQKKRAAGIHGVLNGLGTTSLVSGASVIIYNKASHNGTHFESLHARVGLAVYLLFFLQALFGALAVYAPSLFGGEARAKAMYKYHRLSGYLTFLLSLVAVAAATQTDWNKNMGKINLWPILLAGVLLAVGLGTGIKPNKLGIQ